MRIIIDDLQEVHEVTDKIEKIVEKAIKSTLKYQNYKKRCEVSVSFVDDKQIQEINNQYRNMDKPTDVLSFPIIDFNEEQDDKFGYDCGFLMLGDIIISMEKAVSQAEEYGHSVEREIGFLCVHSTLHLLGFDHDNEENTKIMREKEEAILGEMGLVR